MEVKSHNRPLFYNINMNTIHLENVLPHVFSQQQGDLQSEVWLSDLKLEKGKKYLIEAQSGKGKSTFCSYLLCYRRDYSGSLKFDDVDTMTYRVSDWISVRRNHISMLFQELRLFPELTAIENVLPSITIKPLEIEILAETIICEGSASLGAPRVKGMTS